MANVYPEGMQRIGMALEGTYGTAVKAGFLLEATDNSLDFNQDVQEAVVEAGSEQRILIARGMGTANGGITAVIKPANLGPLFYALLGAESVTGTGPYTHVITPSTDGSVPSLSIEKRFGGIYPIFRGCAITEATFAASHGGFLTGDFTIEAKDNLIYDASQAESSAGYDANPGYTAPMMKILRGAVEVQDTYNPSWTITNELVFAEPEQNLIYTPRNACGKARTSAVIKCFIQTDSTNPEALLDVFYGDSGGAYPQGPAAGDIPTTTMKFEFTHTATIGTGSDVYALTFDFQRVYISSHKMGVLDGKLGFDVELVADTPTGGSLVTVTLVDNTADITAAGTDIT